MQSNRNFLARIETVTLSVRPCNPRVGSTHTYVLNGTLLRDVLVDVNWVTVNASIPLEPRAA